jgi:hypothetical protein
MAGSNPFTDIQAPLSMTGAFQAQRRDRPQAADQVRSVLYRFVP